MIPVERTIGLADVARPPAVASIATTTSLEKCMPARGVKESARKSRGTRARGGGPADTSPQQTHTNRPVPGPAPCLVEYGPSSRIHPASNHPRACPVPNRTHATPLRQAPPRARTVEIAKSGAVTPSAAPWRTAGAARRRARAHPRSRTPPSAPIHAYPRRRLTRGRARRIRVNRADQTGRAKGRASRIAEAT